MSQLTEDDMLKIVMLLDMSTSDIPALGAGRHRFRPTFGRFSVAACRVRPDLFSAILDENGGGKMTSEFFEFLEFKVLYELYGQFLAWVDTYTKDAHS